MLSKKKLKILEIKLFALFSPFFIVCPVAIRCCPMKFLDYEYSTYLQNKEYAQKHEKYARILIMGNSTAKASWIPEELTEDTYNFALAGTSPIEEYYYLREYLQHNKHPEYVMYTQDTTHFLSSNFFWSRSVYFQRLRSEDLQDIFSKLYLYKDTELFDSHNLDIELLSYHYYTPSKYFTAFIKGLLSPKRYDENLKRYYSVINAKGHTLFGTAKCCDDDNYCVKYKSFQVNDMIDAYFRKIIDLCRKYQIQFVFQNPPINKNSFYKLDESFVRDYTGYLECIQKDYPDARIDTELFYYDNDCFGDSMHLNMKGAIQFSKEMKEKYHGMFLKENDKLTMEE